VPDVIVIGGGVVGTMTAWHLAEAGASVTLLERGAIRSANEAGATVLDGGTASGVMASLGRAAARSEPPAAPPVAAPSKSGFENLEDEMASLLGRPKTPS